MDADKLYLLQDGTHAAAADCKADKSGVLRHKNGMAVCLYEDGSPQTVGEDAVRNKNVEAAEAGKEAAEAAVVRGAKSDEAEAKLAAKPVSSAVPVKT